ncbi:MAG TPA: hypothetical protein PLK94_08980 [Alphaproteobacteria bacterium]|nr:hypothetical protein [Alphaproteobacteria bacterium]
MSFCDIAKQQAKRKMPANACPIDMNAEINSRDDTNNVLEKLNNKLRLEKASPNKK